MRILEASENVSWATEIMDRLDNLVLGFYVLCDERRFLPDARDTRIESLNFMWQTMELERKATFNYRMKRSTTF